MIIHNWEQLIPEHNHESIEVRICCEEDGQVPEVEWLHKVFYDFHFNPTPLKILYKINHISLPSIRSSIAEHEERHKTDSDEAQQQS